MMSENQQITRMQDSITLRPAPVVRKPKAQVLDVIVETAPLTVYKVKTARGQQAFKFEARIKKYATDQQLAEIAGTLSSLTGKNGENIPQQFLKQFAELKKNVEARKKSWSNYYQRKQAKIVKSRKDRYAKNPQPEIRRALDYQKAHKDEINSRRRTRRKEARAMRDCALLFQQI